VNQLYYEGILVFDCQCLYICGTHVYHLRDIGDLDVMNSVFRRSDTFSFDVSVFAKSA
jgi:hypothetical protein